MIQKPKPRLTINVGKMVEIALPGYAGPAGYSVVRGQPMIAYRPTESLPKAGMVVTVDGEAWTVLSAQPAEGVKGAWRLEVSK